MTEIHERRLLIPGVMIPGVLDGSKTQHRAPVRADCQQYEKLRLDERGLLRQGGMQEQAWTKGGRWVRCPLGQPGDRLWVPETWALPESYDRENLRLLVNRASALAKNPEMAAEACSRLALAQSWLSYKADPPPRPMTGSGPARAGRWRSPLLMPRWASRITLEIAEVRVERLQDISEEDAKAEGVYNDHSTPDGRGFEATCGNVYRRNFSRLWDSINRKDGTRWADSPWVWVLAFRRITEEAGR